MCQCDSMLSSMTACYPVWQHVIQCGSMLSSVAACYPVWQHVIQCDSMLSSVAACYPVWQLVIQCGNMLSSVAACYPVWQHVIQCDSMLSSVTACYPPTPDLERSEAFQRQEFWLVQNVPKTINFDIDRRWTCWLNIQPQLPSSVIVCPPIACLFLQSPLICCSDPIQFPDHQWHTQEFFFFFWGGGFNKFSWGQRTERTGIWGHSPLVKGSGGSCKLVQEISIHIVKVS